MPHPVIGSIETFAKTSAAVFFLILRFYQGKWFERRSVDNCKYQRRVQMTPVKQSKLYSPDGIHNGDCLAACLASLLDLPLWMVPPFEQMFGRGDWQSRIDQWLERMHGMDFVRLSGHPIEFLPEFYIACGPAARGVSHSVIYRKGLMVHDPHPSDGGISIVEWTWHLKPKP